MKASFTIMGDPMGKQRPRKTRNLRGLYTPKKTHDYEAQVRYLATQSIEKMTTDKSLKVSIVAYFGIPKSYSKKRAKACLEGTEKPNKKPDIDNIAKITLDGMNPLEKVNKALHKKVMVLEGVYKDDAQVTNLHVKKRYSDTARVEVTIEEDNE